MNAKRDETVHALKLIQDSIHHAESRLGKAFYHGDHENVGRETKNLDELIADRKLLVLRLRENRQETKS